MRHTPVLVVIDKVLPDAFEARTCSLELEDVEGFLRDKRGAVVFVGELEVVKDIRVFRNASNIFSIGGRRGEPCGVA